MIELRMPTRRERAWIYRGLAATAPLAVAYGYATANEAALWLAAAGGWLGVGLAAYNTPRLKDKG